MLLRFKASNYLSLRTSQELSLVAAPLKDAGPDLLVNAGHEMLPASVIYGANASGKSNIVKAFGFIRSAVLFSHSRGKPSGRVPREAFALRLETKKSHSVFEIDFIVDTIRYHYGFEVSDDAFESEWLFAFPNRRRQMLFERTGQDFSFGRNLKGLNKVISELTRPNSLFLSAAMQNDHEELTKIGSFFRNSLYYGTISVTGSFLSTQIEEENIDDRILRFLGNIGTGITNYRRTKVVASGGADKFMEELNEFLRMRSPKDVEFKGVGEPIYKIELGHQAPGGETIYFDADKESAGTRRLLMLLGPAFAALDKGSLLVVDEFDASVHTQACEAILALFSSSVTNKRGAQIVATTHDTNLLRSPLLRRDQIWFTEKDREGATHLYPLSDFRTRQGDNLAKGYLQGRYGAIPFAGSAAGFVNQGN